MIPGEWYTPAELHELPSLGTGQADEHVGTTDDGSQRVWHGRTEDSPAVSVETYDGHNWQVTYEGEPRRIRIDWTDKVEIEE